VAILFVGLQVCGFPGAALGCLCGGALLTFLDLHHAA
jgi:hypothetical protein